ncbi:DEAD/DEAH box helicase [Actinocrinis puniceicyclus]|uniref:DEAD/DEAH box helicase n=1 Tax=Actinocrinis puniceicyclus TaxID=977794 RepID=A0A8J7WQQ8_9ACTN|nr:DEAD/DEAH box helicase [Actinocrinis puniceicyclus]MBS2966748.1 DEAD/DEAH box helicase [Actinocrinis puniceicyclus]
MGLMDWFAEPTRQWFTGAFAEPTAAQTGAWEAIGGGHNVLVIAPTGSGKTLAAFLAALDRLAFGPPPESGRRRCRVLYISPLKALGVDVERNLRAPLAGLRQAAVRTGLPEPDVRIAVRSGDTPADERRKFLNSPADILITTPESLFLLLTSQAREALGAVETVIVDEVHAVAGTKRGAHLALSLERLDHLLPKPAQRIGLSATVRPAEEVARFLSGTRPATIVAPPSAKRFDLRVIVPVEDLTALDAADTDPEAVPADEAGRRRASIWPHVENRVADLVEDHSTTLVFANSRRLAERLCNRLNEIHAARLGFDQAAAEPVPAGATSTAGARVPAELMGQSGIASAAPPLLARAHHGSVSKEQRAEVEEALKAGRLPAVVATSSLELGIDMGAVDLVVQVESPPSVASGLQRVGRAGHQVGAVSRGVIFPKFRGDLLQAAVVAERMRGGKIEAIAPVRNPLDVLAQQLVAMCALDGWDTGELLTLVRRAAPFATLTEPVFEAVLDMLAGRYPSDEFAELRPRIVWDRQAGTVTGRPGAQRLAVISGGTIPDRGLFGVFLIGGDDKRGGRRVGELDEEMVYESRVGDVFTLGTSSWRIEDITHEKVLVSPAPGQPGRLPFWKGDALGRPLELGRALGAFTRELTALEPEAAGERLRAAGLDEWAAGNLLAYLAEQREATRHVPDDRTIVVERFHDELGDWRVVIHSPFGAQVHAPWALAIGARLREEFGFDAQVMHGDDGIVLRLPETDWEQSWTGTDADVEGVADGVGGGREGFERPTIENVFEQCARFPADEIEQVVTDQVGASALFAARFRECAGRALLLPRRRPGQRVPLWQQRQRASHLLAVASKYASFPIVLETVRECLQDVFDVPGLAELLGDIEARRVKVVQVETPAPSPFAKSLLFGYVAQFLYEGDSPLAERQAAALSVDPSLLAELLGQPELRDLFDVEVLGALEAELQHLTTDRPARDAEDACDLLRLLGPLTGAQAAERGIESVWLAELERARRVIRVRLAGEERWAAIEDAGRLRDALGVPLPVGVPEAFTEPVADPLGDLMARYARTHAPFAARQAAEHFGLGVAVCVSVLERLAAERRVIRGAFRPDGAGDEWCDARVLRRLRRRTVAALRKQAEPVSPIALARMLPAWQNLGRPGERPDRRLRGVDGVLRAVEQLAGVAVPASALERLILPSRVADYQPAMLDELTTGGEVVWAGAGALAVDDGWVALAPAAIAPFVLPEPAPLDDASAAQWALLQALDRDAGLFFRTLVEHVAQTEAARARGTADAAHRDPDPAQVLAALWDLVWAGRVTNDTYAPIRALLGSGRTAHRAKRPTPRGRYAALRFAAAVPAAATVLPSAVAATAVGRWSRLRTAIPAADPRAKAASAQVLGEVLLDRYGIVTRGAVGAERLPGGFSAVYRVLSAFEEAGRCRRGYFVEGLGAAQFAADGAVDRLRALSGDSEAPAERPATTLLLAAADPANPYGAAVPWPERAHEGAPSAPGHRPGRKAGALVVLVDGELVLYIERGGRTVLSWTGSPAALAAAAQALAAAIRDRRVGALTVVTTDGMPVLAAGSGAAPTPVAAALSAAGFAASPQGLRLRH